MFDEIRKRILALGPQVVEKATNDYIAYRVLKNFVELHIQKNKLKIYLRPVDYDDPENRISKVPETNGWTLNREIQIYNTKDIDYAMKLIEQSYNDVI